MSKEFKKGDTVQEAAEYFAKIEKSKVKKKLGNLIAIQISGNKTAFVYEECDTCNSIVTSDLLERVEQLEKELEQEREKTKLLISNVKLLKANFENALEEIECGINSANITINYGENKNENK